MKKMMIVTSVVVMLTGLNMADAQEAQQPGKEASTQVLKKQTVCPVMGGKIDKKVYADYNGKRVYFCCAGCIPQFKKDPDTYLKKLKAEGIAPESIPAVADTEKKETPKDTGGQAAPKAEHKHGGGCH